MDDDVTERERSIRAQLDIYEAVLAAADRRREVFDLVESAADTEDAASRIRSFLGVSHDGAAAILDMQLRRLTIEERARIRSWRDDCRRSLDALTT